MCVRQCNLLTARLIGKCGVFVWLHSSSGGLEVATCSSIILLSALQSGFFSAVTTTLSYTHSNTYIPIYYTDVLKFVSTPPQKAKNAQFSLN